MPIYAITPVPAPRQVRSDVWKPRPAVLRYRAFKDEVRRQKVTLPDAPFVRFELPMPKTWSKKKKFEMLGASHRQKPDIDNLLKALFDSVFTEDRHIAEVWAQKRWAPSGRIMIADLTTLQFYVEDFIFQ